MDGEGGDDVNITALIIVLIFIAFDILSGWLKALSTGTVDSSVMRKGLFHKLGEILAMIFGYLCEYTFPLAGVPIELPIATGISVYIILMETASIVENIAVMNPQMSNILQRIFNSEKLESMQEGGKHLENESADSSGSADGAMGKW